MKTTSEEIRLFNNDEFLAMAYHEKSIRQLELKQIVSFYQIMLFKQGDSHC
jgi:hypothetical protein